MPNDQDIAVDANHDLLILAGDFVIAPCTATHLYRLAVCEPGSFKQYPTVGAGAARYIDDDDPNGLLRAITIQCAQDGATLLHASISPNGVISIAAEYG